MNLMQEILVAIWQALPRFRGEASLKTFVLRANPLDDLANAKSIELVLIDGRPVRPSTLTVQ